MTDSTPPIAVHHPGFAEGSPLDTPSVDLVRRFEDLRKYRDLLTDPDLAERADKVAQEVEEAMKGASDELIDFVMDKVADYWPEDFDALVNVETDPTGDEEDRLGQLEEIVAHALARLIKNRLSQLIKTGTWRIHG